MNKHEFRARVELRARQRYAQEFPIALLNDLLKDGLIPPGERIGTDGQRPMYRYGFRAYRRALQIVRFRRLGITGRDATRLMLFLKKYSQPPWDVRQPLHTEFKAGAHALLAQVRSAYADNNRPIPPKHKQSFIGQLGELDRDLDAAGLRISENAIVDLLRATKQGAIVDIDPDNLSAIIANIPAAADINSMICDIAIPIIAGLLNIDGSPGDRAQQADSVELLIQCCTDDDLLKARELCSGLMFGGSWLLRLLQSSGFNKPLATAIAKILRTIRDCPSWAASIFMLVLRLLPLKKAFDNSLADFLNANADQRSTSAAFSHAGVVCFLTVLFGASLAGDRWKAA